MPEDDGDRLDDLETLTRQIAGVVCKMDAALDELRAFNREQLAINARLEQTQARIETLLARLSERSTNGRDA